MNLLRSAGREFFLDEIFTYISTNFRHQYENIRVVLPNGFLCLALQNKFLSTKKALILPNIITLGEIMAEGHEILKMPHSSVGAISPLEEKIILGEIIHSYSKFNFSLAASIKFAPELAKLFYEIELNHLQIDKLKSISGVEEAKHWQDIYQFIEYAYNRWQEQINISSKLSRANFQQRMCNAEISRLKNSPQSHLIIAGIVPTNKMEQEFFVEILQLNAGHIILPHFPVSKLEGMVNIDENKVKPEHPLYRLLSLYKYLVSNDVLQSPNEIRPILSSNIKSDSRFDHLLSIKNSQKPDINLARIHDNPSQAAVEYIQFDSIYDEAEFIGARCKEILQSNPDASIAIVNASIACKNIYKKTLIKYVRQVRDLIGDNILENNAICLMIDWADFCCNSFDLNKFFKLIGNPEIASKQTIYLKKILLATNRFASSLVEIKMTIDNADDKVISRQQLLEVKAWFEKYSSLFEQINGSNFTRILYKIIHNIERINKNIWLKYQQYKLAESVREIYHTSWNSNKICLTEFPDLLRSCLQSNRIFTQEHNCKVVIGRLSDTSLVAFDYSFIVDASEGNLPPSLRENPWLNRHAQQELGVFLNSNTYAASIYNFYLNLGASNVCITRSSTQLGSKDTIESSLLLQIKLCSNLVREYIHNETLKKQVVCDQVNKVQYAYADQFPSQISATDIETLIRAPYNFYAKKILQLKALNQLEDYPSFAEFGNFFHAVAENYTNQYAEIKTNSIAAKIEVFNHISETLLLDSFIPEYSKKLWLTKVAILADEFVEFEDKRRQGCCKVYTEIRGQITLPIAGKEIKIIAIADRIEVTNQGQAIILDYKTGTPPTKSELLSGQSPQLIIEALIMQNGGFNIAENDSNNMEDTSEEKNNSVQSYEVHSVIFVKIASSKPYIRLIEVELNKSDLSDHMDGLKSLLEHYVSTGKYQIDKCDLKYDDYNHLARR